MQEEFHGNGTVWGETVTQWKLLYGWRTINASVWLLSLSELVGYDPNRYNEERGTCLSAMQGLNLSSWCDVDMKGGDQFFWFKQFNQSGGGEAITNICNQENVWLRSTYCLMNSTAWRTTNASSMNTAYVTESHAVHPAVSSEQAPYLVDASSISLGLVFVAEMIDSR